MKLCQTCGQLLAIAFIEEPDVMKKILGSGKLGSSLRLILNILKQESNVD